MIIADFPTNLIQFQKQFGTEEACLRYIRKQRWRADDAFECPKCKHKIAWNSKTREILICAACERHVSITAGTQFHKTRKSLVLWFMAMYLMNTSKRGISAKELQRQLGLKSYQTAWAWLHKLRSGMIDPNRAALSGFVEVDETYYGGMCEGHQGRSTEKKALVACAVEKIKNSCGRVRLSVIPNASKETLKGFILGKIELESILRTDGWVGYSGIDTAGYEHMPTKIGKQKSRANEILPKVHRVFSLLKRWLLSTHQGAVSQKHLQAYLEEFTFRFNRRTSKNLLNHSSESPRVPLEASANPIGRSLGGRLRMWRWRRYNHKHHTLIGDSAVAETELTPEDRHRIYEEEKARIEATSSERSAIRNRRIWAVVFLVLIVAVVWGLRSQYVAWDQAGQQNPSTTAPSTMADAPQPSVATVLSPVAAESSIAGLAVKQWSFVKTRGLDGELTYEVSGEITNSSSHSYSSAYLDVALYDNGGNIVATSTVSAGNIPAGGKGIISGYVIDKTSTPHPRGEMHVSTASRDD